jgi:hypothetical protein
MTREEFKRLEEICKRAWRELARSGNRMKPRYLRLSRALMWKYNCNCPACSVSYLASVATGRVILHKWDMEQPNNLRYDCRYCPITSWRRKARKEYLLGNRGVCPCEDGIFSEWDNSFEKELRKIAAAKIAKLNWSWLKIYAKVKKP